MLVVLHDGSLMIRLIVERLAGHVRAAFVLSAALFLTPAAIGQMPGPAEQERATAAEIAQLDRRARESKDPEEIIALVERALRLEPTVVERVVCARRPATGVRPAG